jgi:hypothetical protein
MTVSHSSKTAIAEVTASSVGGAFLIVYALGLYAGQNFLNPLVWKTFGILAAMETVAAIILKADRRVIVLSMVLTGGAFAGSLTIHQHAFFPIAFMLAASLVFLGYLVWFYRESIGSFVGLSGAISGAILLWFLTSHFLRATNSFVLVGAGLAYIMGRRGIREGKDPATTYKALFVNTMLPCFLILVIGGIGYGKWLYPVAALSFASGVGLSYVEMD